MSAIENSYGAAGSRLLVLSALCSAFAGCLLNFNSDAATWPAIDNLPAVCRTLDAGCLAGDFFTNASSELTPRRPYIHLLAGLAGATGHGIASGLQVVKALLMAFLPALWSVLVVASVVERSAAPRLTPGVLLAAIAAPILVVLLHGELGGALSVAWWRPLSADATPHNLSLLLALAGFFLINLEARTVGAALVFAAGIFHPVVCLFAAVFCCLLLPGRVYPGLVASVAAAIIVKLVFDSGSALSAEAFVRIYAVEAHPSHYLPSQFGSLSALPWHASFLAVLVGLAVVAAVLRHQGSAAWRNALLALGAYLGAVALQYLLVEVYPVKLVAAVGPSRFTMFGPWLLSIFVLLAIAKPVDGNRRLQMLAASCERWLASVRWRYAGYACLLPALFVAPYAWRTADIELPDPDSRELARFATEATRKEDVFVLPFHAPRAAFPLQTGRAIFHGNGFPFSEKHFAEWDARNALVNGRSPELAAYPGSWVGEKYARHYRALKAVDFLRAASAYRLDWVVVETAHAGSFAGCNAGFRSARYQAYSLAELRACAGPTG